jgi:hypothetical protein
MIDRTPNYKQLSEDEQREKVKVVLDCEAALAYLEQSELIKPNCSMAEFQYDFEYEDVLIDVFYVSADEAIDRALQAYNLTKEEAENLETAVNILQQDESLVELAKKKLEQIQKNKVKNHHVEQARQRVAAAKAQAARKQKQAAKKVVPFKRRSN